MTTVAEAPTGYRDIPEAEQKKAKAFFDRARTVAESGQYDYAIAMFIEGLNIDPDSVGAHQALREISLRRKVSGGKPLGMMESMRLARAGKDDKQNMLNAERRLAYDPGNVDLMKAVLQYAHKAGFYDTVLWIGQILFKANSESKSPDFNIYIVLRDVYKDLKLWKLATECCQKALELRPDDMDLQSEVKNLASLDTMYSAGYIRGGSFRGSLRDQQFQDQLIQQDSDHQSEEALQRAIDEAEAQHAADPEEPGKLMRLVDALLKTENMEHENRAIELLDEAYQRTRQFRFRQRIGRIKMDQMRRMERSLRHAAEAAPADPKLAAEYQQFLAEQLDFELKEYRLWAEHYPTDLSLKYELGQRLFMLKKYDEAIPLFQQAREDPKLRVDCSIWLARSFLEAGFVDEAIETLQAVIDDYQLKGDDRSKEMYYWQGRAYEEKNNSEMAIRRYSQVAQWEFLYKDVQVRIRKLRGQK